MRIQVNGHSVKVPIGTGAPSIEDFHFALELAAKATPEMRAEARAVLAMYEGPWTESTSELVRSVAGWRHHAPFAAQVANALLVQQRLGAA